MSIKIFHEPQDVSFPKMYGKNCLSECDRWSYFQGLAHANWESGSPIPDTHFCCVYDNEYC